MQSIDWLGAVQWPAMLVTVTAAWLVASSSRERRLAGFWLFLLSNALWITWAAHTKGWALLALQVCLAFINIRGERRNRADNHQEGHHAW